MMLTIQIIYIVFFLLLVVGINVGLRRTKEKEKEKGILHSKNRDIYIPRKSSSFNFSKNDDYLKLRN
jgi:hypothetical protein